MSRNYYIPTNYKDAGFLFNGMISKRNALDAIVFAIIGYFISVAIPFNEDSQISATILIAGIMGMLGVSGFHGIPFSVFLFDIIRWKKRNQTYLYNNHGRTFSITAADAMLAQPQLRDSIADVIDRAISFVQKEDPNYIEGETFEFATDPELENLAAAEERLRLKKDQTKSTEPDIPTADDAGSDKTVQPTSHIDIQNLVDSIVLEDI